MPLPTSGQLTLNQINVEAGGTSLAQSDINNEAIRSMIGKADGAQASFSEYYGASLPEDWTVLVPYAQPTISGFAIKNGSYRSTSTASDITLTLPSGTFCYLFSIGATRTQSYYDNYITVYLDGVNMGAILNEWPGNLITGVDNQGYGQEYSDASSRNRAVPYNGPPFKVESTIRITTTGSGQDSKYIYMVVQPD